jgi:hypothetical protein
MQKKNVPTWSHRKLSNSRKSSPAVHTNTLSALKPWLWVSITFTTQTHTLRHRLLLWKRELRNQLKLTGARKRWQNKRNPHTDLPPVLIRQCHERFTLLRSLVFQPFWASLTRGHTHTHTNNNKNMLLDTQVCFRVPAVYAPCTALDDLLTILK